MVFYTDMQIYSIQTTIKQNINKQNHTPTFEAKGKPISLEYIIKKHEKVLPERVLNNAKKAISNANEKNLSLKEIHLRTYEPLLRCKTLDEAKELFSEFKNIKEDFKSINYSKNIESFKTRTGKNYALKFLQEYWGKLKSKEELVKTFGLTSRGALDWILNKINFEGFKHNYITIINASDEEGNKIIAAKTAAWNALHPEYVLAKNKHAAQACKTEKFRKEQSKRMKEYDKEHPERRDKIGKSTKRAWDLCPEVKEAMKIFLKNSPPNVKSVMFKDMKDGNLNEQEYIIKKAFFKYFWESHPEMKEIYTKARKSQKTMP